MNPDCLLCYAAPADEGSPLCRECRLFAADLAASARAARTTPDRMPRRARRPFRRGDWTPGVATNGGENGDLC